MCFFGVCKLRLGVQLLNSSFRRKRGLGRFGGNLVHVRGSRELIPGSLVMCWTCDFFRVVVSKAVVLSCCGLDPFLSLLVAPQVEEYSKECGNGEQNDCD